MKGKESYPAGWIEATMEDISSNKIIPEQPLKTPVLFLVFNRLDTTKEVLQTIRNAKPSRLYIAADGPRGSHPGEDEKIRAVRDYVLGHIDWDCKVKTLFREKNLGCKYAVSSGIDWFFENEEMGIILEDDCLPARSFFLFCEELLAKYQHDNTIMHISGFNPLVAYQIDSSYCFSRFGPIWGWASWRRAWEKYDVNMSSWPEKRQHLLRDGLAHSNAESKWRQTVFDKVYTNHIDTWDYQWSFARLVYRGLSIMPRVSLISNIGFSGSATHTVSEAPDHYLRHYELEFPLYHPPSVLEDTRFGKLYLENFAMPSRANFLKRVGKRIISRYRNGHPKRVKINRIFDSTIRPVDKFDRYLLDSEFCNVVKPFDRSSDRFWYWLGKADSAFLKYRYPHKKALDFFFSAQLLEIRPDDVVLDAARGRSEYLTQIKRNCGCQHLYLNDQIFTDDQTEINGIKMVGGDATKIALPDSSVTKIACHHAIEHFRGNMDMKFVIELSRLLQPGGRACIIPLFISYSYAEVWNIKPEACYDGRALTIADPTASVPGADNDGHFARIYDCQALIERVLKTAYSVSLKSKVIECTLDKNPVPDMHINVGSNINRPLRALLFEKV